MNPDQISREFTNKIYVGGPTNLWGDSSIKFKSDFYFKPPSLARAVFNPKKKPIKKKKKKNKRNIKKKEIGKKEFFTCCASPAVH